MARRTPARSSKSTVAQTPLSKDFIIQTAIDLINESGSTEFSMRSLASRLEVYPTALYWHVGDRGALLAAIGTRWMSGIIPPYQLDDWESWARSLAHRYREACHREPNIAHLLGSQLLNDPGGIAIAEATVAHLVVAGVPDNLLVQTYNAVSGAIVGFVDIELARIEDDDDHSRARAIEESMTNIDPLAFPVLAPRMANFADNAFSLRWTPGAKNPMDESFEALLTMLINGIRATSSAAKNAPAHTNSSHD